MATRKFHFSLPVVLGASRHLHDAPVHPDHATAMTERLNFTKDTPRTEAVRQRFLLGKFSPRDCSEPSGGTQVPNKPTPVESTL